MLCVFVIFGVQSILAVEDQLLLDEYLLGHKLARSVSKICCHNELLISLINGESSGSRVYSVCQSWLNFQNIGQGLDHLSLVGSIREHTPCTMSLGMRTHGNRQF